MLVAKGRMKTRYPLKEWFDFATLTFGIAILPLTPDVAREAYELPGKFHKDPADRLIVATARIHNCVLLTEDSKIRKLSACEGGLKRSAKQKGAANPFSRSCCCAEEGESEVGTKPRSGDVPDSLGCSEAQPQDKIEI